MTEQQDTTQDTTKKPKKKQQDTSKEQARIAELEEKVRTLEQKLAHLQTQHKRLLQKSTGKVGNPNNPRAL